MRVSSPKMFTARAGNRRFRRLSKRLPRPHKIATENRFTVEWKALRALETPPGAARTEQLVPVQCRGARRHAVLDRGALLADLAGAKRTRSSQVIRHNFGRPYFEVQT